MQFVLWLYNEHLIDKHLCVGVIFLSWEQVLGAKRKRDRSCENLQKVMCSATLMKAK